MSCNWSTVQLNEDQDDISITQKTENWKNFSEQICFLAFSRFLVEQSMLTNITKRLSKDDSFCKIKGKNVF